MKVSIIKIRYLLGIAILTITTHIFLILFGSPPMRVLNAADASWTFATDNPTPTIAKLFKDFPRRSLLSVSNCISLFEPFKNNTDLETPLSQERVEKGGVEKAVVLKKMFERERKVIKLFKAKFNSLTPYTIIVSR